MLRDACIAQASPLRAGVAERRSEKNRPKPRLPDRQVRRGRRSDVADATRGKKKFRAEISPLTAVPESVSMRPTPVIRRPVRDPAQDSAEPGEMPVLP
jgi:hypothetical protein